MPLSPPAPRREATKPGCRATSAIQRKKEKKETSPLSPPAAGRAGYQAQMLGSILYPAPERRKGRKKKQIAGQHPPASERKKERVMTSREDSL